MLCEIAVMYICVRVLIEEYRVDKKSSSQNKECDCKSDNAAGGKLCKLGRCYKYLRLQLGNLCHRIRVRGTNLRNSVLKLVYPILKFLGFAHKQNVARI